MLPLHLKSHASSLPPQPSPPQAASDSREAYYFAKEIPANIPSYKQPCKKFP